MSRMTPILKSTRHGAWSLGDTYGFIATFLNKSQSQSCRPLSRRHPATPNQARAYHSSNFNRRQSSRLPRSCVSCRPSYDSRRLLACIHHSVHKRHFHDYFVSHLPSSSLHPDSRSSGPHHKLPRADSTPHTNGSKGPVPAAAPPNFGASRELTVLRIPIRSAKHHFGVSVSRGTRPYNEDTFQAGTLELPAFAKRAPISLSRKGTSATPGGATSADNSHKDPQVFYFGVFDGHGGNECSDFLREELHTYVEETAKDFQLGSSLQKETTQDPKDGEYSLGKGKDALDRIEMKSKEEVGEAMKVQENDAAGGTKKVAANPALESEDPLSVEADIPTALQLEKSLVAQWKETVGGYFRRFKPEYFSASMEDPSTAKVSINTVLMYAFLKADLDFVIAQARKPDPENDERALNADDILGEPGHLSPSTHRIGGPTRFFGGSTASVALISTPSPTPFWHPASPSTIITAHVGDTRIILCDTATGLARPLTTNHHPSSPIEGNRLRRYAATFVTDSFGEERMSGLANTRAFGDMRSKRIGVSAEPEIRRIEIAPAEYSFLVLISDGVSGTLADQEIVDIVKEAKTPEQGARDVVGFATEVSKEGDNATCLVVRLGGWERRIEGGMGSMGTREQRDYRRREALDPRSRRT